MSTSNQPPTLLTGLAVLAVLALGTAAGMAAEAAVDVDLEGVTFTKDIAPIMQRSCQDCHKPDSVAPMSLITYEQVRPWARGIPWARWRA